MKKRVLLLILCTCIIMGTAQIPVTATPPKMEGIQPYWINTSSISLTMSYSSGKVNWVGQIVGYSGTTRIAATYMLEKKGSDGSYTYVASWPNLQTYSSILISSDSATGTAGTYRLSVAAIVVRNGFTETVTDSLEKTLP